jgi:hypothetical protein
MGLNRDIQLTIVVKLRSYKMFKMFKMFTKKINNPEVRKDYAEDIRHTFVRDGKQVLVGTQITREKIMRDFTDNFWRSILS